MTNFEWFKSDDERLKDFLAISFAVDADTGEIAKCVSMPCGSCLFDSSKNNGQPCHASCRKWLDKEHVNRPLYKKGDVILTWSDHVYLVISSSKYRDKLSVASNVSNLDIGRGVYISKDHIRLKIGNIYEDTASEIAYELVGHVNILKKED